MVSMARTPRANWLSIISRRNGCGAEPSTVDGLGVGQCGPVVDGPAQAVEDAAEQTGANLDAHRLERGLDGRTEMDALEITEGHAGQAVALDGDDFGVEHPAVAPDAHGVAHGGFDALDLEAESDQTADPAGAPRRAGMPCRAEDRLLPDGHRLLRARSRSGPWVGSGSDSDSDKSVGWVAERRAQRTRARADSIWASMRHGPASMTQPPRCDRFVGHHGDPAVGDIGLEVGHLDDLVGVEAHDQVLARRGQAQGPADGRRDVVIGERRARGRPACG